MTATTLSAAVAATDTTIGVTGVTDFPTDRQFDVQVGDETMRVVAGPPATTWSVERSDLAADTLILRDDFDREEIDGLGEAAAGYEWRRTHPVDWDLTVTGGVARAQALVAGSITDPVVILPERVLHQQARIRFRADRLPNGGDTEVALMMRDLYDAPAGTAYRGFAVITTAGAVSCHWDRIVSSVQTSLGASAAASGTFAANEWWWLAAEVVGVSPSNLRVKAWREDDGEPGSWVTTTTDSTAGLQVDGNAGWRLRTNAANTNLPVFEMDTFSITRQPLGAAHSLGDAVVLVEAWDGPVMPTVQGAPTANPPTGAYLLDIDARRLYVRVGATWRYEDLT